MLDADGLNAHAEEGGLEQLAKREAPTVLTPHAGELGRLLELPSAEIDAHRLEHVLAAAARAQAVVVLKGDDTLVADADGRVGVSRGRCAGARDRRHRGRSRRRDGAFLAKGLEPFTAACAAVSTHVLAGTIAARDGGRRRA